MHLFLLCRMAFAGITNSYLVYTIFAMLMLLSTNLNSSIMNTQLEITEYPYNMMIVSKALEEYGNEAERGDQHNEKIKKYLNVLKPEISNDDWPWCSAFLAYVTQEIGIPQDVTLASRSWLKVGDEVKNPIQGDIVVFWRHSPKSWKGHAAIYMKETENEVYVLGGNQSNMVKISRYPKSRVIGYRRMWGKGEDTPLSTEASKKKKSKSKKKSSKRS